MTTPNWTDTLKADLLAKLAGFGVDKDASAGTLEDTLATTGHLLDRFRAFLDGADRVEGLEDLKVEAGRHTRFLEARSHALDRFREVDATPNAAREAKLATLRTALKATPFLTLRGPQTPPLPVLYLLHRVQQTADPSARAKLALLVRHFEGKLADGDLAAPQPDALAPALTAAMDLEPTKPLQAEIERLLRQLTASQNETIAQKSEVDKVRVQVTQRDAAIAEHQQAAGRLLQEAREAQERFGRMAQELAQARAEGATLAQQYRFHLDESARYQTEGLELAKKLQKLADHVRFLEGQVESNVKDIKEKDRELARLRERHEALLSQDRETGRSGLSFVRSQTPVRTDASRTAHTSYLLTAKGADAEDPNVSGPPELLNLIDSLRTATNGHAASLNRHMKQLQDTKKGETGAHQQAVRQLAVAKQQLRQRQAPTAPLTGGRSQSALQWTVLALVLLVVGLSYYQVSRGPYNAH